VLADALLILPAVVENDTTTPLSGFPFVSVTVAVMVLNPPPDGRRFGVAVT